MFQFLLRVSSSCFIFVFQFHLVALSLDNLSRLDDRHVQVKRQHSLCCTGAWLSGRSGPDLPSKMGISALFSQVLPARLSIMRSSSRRGREQEEGEGEEEEGGRPLSLRGLPSG